ncbi:50S ribosomal protein L31 [bacterium]|nr:50S ribosomal protein L31 [bacterium]NBX48847.1 50S ribosomal protein L31 [bacterium]
MKANIHPEYFPTATIACACGATYTTGSVKEHIDIELCATCHPFFTGKQKIVDTARRVEKFTNRAEAKADGVATAKEKAAKKAERAKAKEAKRADRDTSIKSVNR